MIDLIQKYVTPGPAVKLSTQLGALIRSGKVPPEALLPPVRDFARAVGVSPGTAATVYKTLRAQGLVSTDGRRGTRILPQPAQREYLEPPLPAGALDLQAANPDPALLPDLRGVFARLDPISETYGARHLDPRLQAMAQRAMGRDGISAEHLVVTSGAIPAIHRALRVCLNPGDKVAVEDPGFNDHHASVETSRMVCVPVEMDDAGMLPESLASALRQGVRGAILSPRWQSPTGAAFTPERAAALQRVLAGFPATLVILDDYGGLLAQPPYRDCLGESHERWLVVRSFNKCVAPDLRVGFGAGDGETVDRMRRDQWLTDGWVSAYLQRAAAEVMRSRATAPLFARAKKAYATRRTALLSALQERGIDAHGASGLNVWIPVRDEALIVSGMLARGFCVRSGARYRIRSPAAVRITTAQLPPKTAKRVAQALAVVLQLGNGRAP